MTSDAKIGLLLGLVFIFVIAFIINGLPNFGNRANSAEATPMVNFENDNLGLVDNAQNAQERLDWEQMLAEGGETLTDFQPAVAESELATDVESSETVVAVDTEDVRSVFPLGSLRGVSRTIEDVVRGIGEASRSVTLQAEASGPAPAIQTPTAKREDSRPAETVTPTTSAAKRETAKRSARMTYVVQAGDVLATIAKKVYGPEEGNRLANVTRIFEANRTALTSPDEIFVGQKLIIPALLQAKAADKQQDALSEALFEKVQNIGKRNLADMKVEVPKGRYYVVQDGDSLWKIATGHLGNGARFEEILKLNTDILKSKDTQLDIGMRLRLPTK
jgi:nucleoid-associated protein YgaU